MELMVGAIELMVSAVALMEHMVLVCAKTLGALLGTWTRRWAHMGVAVAHMGANMDAALVHTGAACRTWTRPWST